MAETLGLSLKTVDVCFSPGSLHGEIPTARPMSRALNVQSIPNSTFSLLSVATVRPEPYSPPTLPACTGVAYFHMIPTATFRHSV